MMKLLGSIAKGFFSIIVQPEPEEIEYGPARMGEWRILHGFLFSALVGARGRYFLLFRRCGQRPRIDWPN